MDVQYLLNVWMKFFPKSDLAYWSRDRDVGRVNVSLAENFLTSLIFIFVMIYLDLTLNQ